MYRETTALGGGSRWRTGNAHLSSWEPCTSGQGEGCAERALEARGTATAPFTPLGKLSQYLCSWKRALHCCDAVPCMLHLVRITAKPCVPGGLRGRRCLKVPRGPSRPISCPSEPPTLGIASRTCEGKQVRVVGTVAVWACFFISHFPCLCSLSHWLSLSLSNIKKKKENQQ